MSGGFVLPPKPATIAFDDGSDLHGLEVEVNLRCSMDFLFRIWQFGPDTTNDDLKGVIDEFAERYLLGWNLTDDDGSAVPVSAATFWGALDPESVQVLLAKYARAVRGVSAPLAPPSSVGEPSEESPA